MNPSIVEKRNKKHEQKLIAFLESRIEYNHNLPFLSSPCLVHNKGLDKYGSMYYKGKVRHYHRLSWLYYNGEIPKGQNILHRCNIKACSNILHLYIGTQSENILDTKIENRKGIEELTIERMEKELLQYQQQLNSKV